MKLYEDLLSFLFGGEEKTINFRGMEQQSREIFSLNEKRAAVIRCNENTVAMFKIGKSIH